jgi:hypothetical protein
MGGNTIEPGKVLTKDENILTAWILYEINWLINEYKDIISDEILCAKWRVLNCNFYLNKGTSI